MYCGNCGSYITDNSKFCSQCGARTAIRPPGRITEPTYSTIDQPLYVQNQAGTSQDKGFLICGIILFAIDIFWAVFPRIVDNWYEYRAFTFPLSIIGYGIPIMFAVFTKRTDYKIVLFILGGILLCWSIIQNLIEFSGNLFNF